MAQDHEKKETKPEDESRIIRVSSEFAEHANECSNVSIKEKQIAQLYDFINLVRQDNFVWHDGEYITIASNFFAEDTQLIIENILGDYMYEDWALSDERKLALDLIFQLCTLHPERMLSGQEVTGDIMISSAD